MPTGAQFTWICWYASSALLVQKYTSANTDAAAELHVNSKLIDELQDAVIKLREVLS